MEKIYKTMQGTGVINIVIGSVIITVGLAAGVMAIVSEIGRASCRERV